MIAEVLQQIDIPVSANIVARLLYQMHFSLRVDRKQIVTNSSPYRDQQRQMGSLASAGERSRLPLRCQRGGHLLRHLRPAEQPRHRLHRHLAHDTPAFAAHSIATWWKREGTRRHGRAPKLLVLADSGGSHGCSSWAWKTEIQAQLCNQFGITATIAHYPTGASKWNPIEHRLFSEISKHWAAEPLVSY